MLARTQALKGGPEVLSTRRCPVSYGVLCREAYDPIRHQGEDVEQDPYDKKRYAEKQVSWFIRQVSLPRISVRSKRSADRATRARSSTSNKE